MLPVLSVAAPMTDLPDPTLPTSGEYAATSDAAEFQLRYTLVEPGRRVAIINHQTVKEGDSIGATKVIRIRKNKVVLKSPGRGRQEIFLYSAKLKSKPKRDHVAR